MPKITPARHLTLPLAAAAVLLAQPAMAALVVTSAGQNIAQDFNSLTSITTAQTWANDSTLAGWSLFAAAGTPVTTYLGATGVNTAGSFYSFGNGADRALGGIGSGAAYFGSPASGAIAGWVAVAITNGSGQSLDGFSLGFDGEQWRNGGNASLAAQSMVLEYGFGATFAGVGTWSAPGALFDWTSTVNTATAGAVDGNAAGRVAGRGGAIGTAWAAGETLWLRWVERNDTGNDHGLAIDNFSFTAGDAVAPIPLPAPALLLAGGLGVLATRLRRRRGAA